MPQSPSRLVSLIVVLAVIVSAGFIMARPSAEKPIIGENEQSIPVLKSFSNSIYGIQFMYPESYIVAEQDLSINARETRHVITLVHKNDVDQLRENSEGPTAITIDVFDNRAATLGLEQWIRREQSSNYSLSIDQNLATSTVYGKPALQYTWDGLYRGDSVVVQSGGRIYMFSVTYMDSAAPIKDDFKKVLASVIFT